MSSLATLRASGAWRAAPTDFRSERFLDRRPVASEWFPFGGAVRHCIGTAFAKCEAKIVLPGAAERSTWAQLLPYSGSNCAHVAN
jgi:cytochrome P450